MSTLFDKNEIPKIARQRVYCIFLEVENSRDLYLAFIFSNLKKAHKYLTDHNAQYLTQGGYKPVNSYTGFIQQIRNGFVIYHLPGANGVKGRLKTVRVITKNLM